MGTLAVRLGIAGLCASVVCGCASENISRLNPWSGDPEQQRAEADRGAVRTIGFADSRSCRFIDRFTVKHQSQQGDDSTRAGEALARRQAADKGGNAILIDSVSHTPALGAGKPAVYAAQGAIYACP